LFDMDGVLIDAKQRHKEAFLTALKNQWCVLSDEYHDTILDGIPTQEKITHCVKK
jgi:beta-phosphoglucomutase-like phosphatase (HAD superfamily)